MQHTNFNKLEDSHSHENWLLSSIFFLGRLKAVPIVMLFCSTQHPPAINEKHQKTVA